MAFMPENKNSVDAIVALGLQLDENGEPKPELLQRVDKAVELFHGYSSSGGMPPLLIMSGRHSINADKVPPRTEAEVMKEYALSLATPEELIEMDEWSFETTSNGIATRRIAEKLGLRRLAVVSTPYHLDVASEAFPHVYGPEFEISFVPSSNLPPTPDQMRYRRAARKTLRSIIDFTACGNVEEIQIRIMEVMPKSRPLFAAGQLQKAVYLERGRRTLAQAA